MICDGAESAALHGPISALSKLTNIKIFGSPLGFANFIHYRYATLKFDLCCTIVINVDQFSVYVQVSKLIDFL